MIQIRIDSILGGESLMTNLAAKDQFNQSLGIDPAYPLDVAIKGTNSVVGKASGIIRPVGATKFTGTTLTSAPMWQISNPKNALVYVYDALGSAYSIDPSGPTITALSDVGTLTTGNGDGAEYLDNYIYFKVQSDLTRYGPLNGTPKFVPNYWTNVLGLSNLVPFVTPTEPAFGIKYPGGPLHRHSDGKMYILHTTGGQGAISFVSTTKTSVEGDTNNGSTFAKLLFGYGLYPMSVASYGSGLVFGLFETSLTASHNKTHAKLAFWDTVSASWNNMLWDEFPDEIITAIRNIDGVLWIASGNYGQYGCRISKYVGGYSIKEVAYYENAIPPMQGAMDGQASNLIFGSTTDTPEPAGAVYSIGLHKSGMSNGLFKTMRATAAGTSAMVTSLGLNHFTAFAQSDPWVGWGRNITDGTNNGIDQASDDCSVAPVIWQSQVYKVGMPFNVARVRIPLAKSVAAGMTLTAKLWFDNKATSYTLPVINNTTFPNGEIIVGGKIDNNANPAFGQSNIMLELKWSGTVLCPVDFPITLELDPVPD